MLSIANSKPRTGGVIIFIGPSAPENIGDILPGADIRPPIRRGDLNSINMPETVAVGIVDGLFHQNLAISPKEILPLLDLGVAVYGASSMGALRATELEPFGMIGVGKIFRLFKAGILEADDEVAMIYSVEGHTAISEPLVNMRFALRAAQDYGLISASERRHLVRLAKRVYYPERTFDRLLNDARTAASAIDVDRLEAFLETEAPNTKQEDAVELLRLIAHDFGHA